MVQSANAFNTHEYGSGTHIPEPHPVRQYKQLTLGTTIASILNYNPVQNPM